MSNESHDIPVSISGRKREKAEENSALDGVGDVIVSSKAALPSCVAAGSKQAKKKKKLTAPVSSSCGECPCESAAALVQNRC